MNRSLFPIHDRVPIVLEPLTPREQDVLRGIAQGMSNLEIARAHAISVNTVKTFVKRVHTKLGSRNRVEALLRARDLRLLD